MTPAQRTQLDDYRSTHRIKVALDRDDGGFRGFDRYVCVTDGLRVHPNRRAGWRHDLSEVKALARAEVGL